MGWANESMHDFSNLVGIRSREQEELENLKLLYEFRVQLLDESWITEAVKEVWDCLRN